MKIKIKKWHWRDIISLLLLKCSKRGYKVSTMCGKCNKCNRIIAAAGLIPCPLRWKEKSKEECIGEIRWNEMTEGK